MNEISFQLLLILNLILFAAAKDDLIFEWVTTEWSRCSQTCGGGGFQVLIIILNVRKLFQ